MLGSVVLRVYNFIFWLSTPYVILLLQKRIKRGKEDKKRWRERIGKTNLARPRGGRDRNGGGDRNGGDGDEKIIWVNAVSVGEVLAVIPLIERLPEIYPRAAAGAGGAVENIKVLLTTSTLTAASVVKNRLPADTFHQYMAIDHPLYVRRFLLHWQPVAAIWVESELWPNMINQAAKQGIPMMLVNGRLSPKTIKNWSRVKFFSKFLLSRFDICLVQNEENKKAFVELGAGHVEVSGNLKYDANPLSYEEAALQDWRDKLQGHHVFLAASTHEGEEDAIIQAHQALTKRGKKIKTFIAPRHPARAQAVADVARKYGDLKIGFYSQKGGEGSDDIYIVDKIGALGLFYRLADIVFMGGSFIPHGGQNLLEPARLDCALLSGEYVFNFQETYDLCAQKKAVEFVAPENLPAALTRLLENPEAIRTMAANAKASAASVEGVLDKTLRALKPVLEKINVTTT